ncbi:hypothetical protein [Glycomyces sp. NPDC047010]|uniref:hypothetical protein n=1 Tax=Glycomyces sp. NPDC047010 TaxID=3155023 RepID=UPI0033DE5C28
MSDRTVPRPDPAGRDFVADFGAIADTAEAWAASVEDAHDADVTAWESYAPGIVVHRTAAEYAAGTGTTAANVQSSVCLAYGFVLVRYSWVYIDTFWAATMTLPTPVDYPPAIAYGRTFAGDQVKTTATPTSIVIGNTGALMTGTMYLASARYAASGAPEAGDWVLDDAAEQLGLNTILN